MKISNLFILLFSLILASCSLSPPLVINKVSEPQRPDLRELARLINIYAVQLDHTERLHLENSCVRADKYVDHITVSFSSQDIKELKEVRRQLVDFVEGLLERVNSHPQLVIPQYTMRPVTAENLTISIVYESFWIRFGDPTYIGWVLLKDGIVKFFDGDPENLNTDLLHYRLEPYSHSRDIVMFQREGEMLFQSQKKSERTSTLENERFVPNNAPATSQDRIRL